MTSNDSVEVQAVVQRFREASDMLEALQDRLSSIASTDVARREAATSLDAAANGLQQYTVVIAEATTAIAEATQRTQEAMGAAQKFLKGTDVSTLKASVEETSSGVNDLRTLFEQNSKKLTSAVEATKTSEAAHAKDILLAIKTLSTDMRKEQKNLADAQAKIDSLEQKVRQLETKIAAVPEKYRSKFGL
jgi:chromosome segregation ATPase